MYTSVSCTDLLNGAKREPGVQPERKEQHNGEAEPSPHIRRPSRYEKSCSIKQELKNLLRRGTQRIRTQQNQAGSGGIQKEAIASRHYNPKVERVDRCED